MRRAPLHASDLELARAAAGGDARAFQRIFDHAFPRLFRFAMARCGDREVAEESVQAALCTAFAHLRSYRGEAALLTWLTTICRREMNARRIAPAAILSLDEVESWLESLPAESEDALDRLDRRQLAARVHAVLDWLPPGAAQLLTWKYFEEASVAEIARRLGVGLKAAESRLTRAREAFRREFDALADAVHHPSTSTV